MKKLLAVLLALLLVATFVACNNDQPSSSPDSTPESTPESGDNQELQTLKIAASPAPHAEILEFIKPLLLEKGIDLEIVEFTDYVQPNNVVDSGDFDANYFQHEPYLLNFNEENGTDLVTAAYIHFEPLGIYPGKTATLEELPEGAVIGVPNDTTNEARALNLLAAQGIITLKEGVGLNATPNDIIENPKNVQIQELEAAQVPLLLPDMDFAVVNGNYAVGAGIIDSVLVTEASDSQGAQEFANVIAVRSTDKEDARILTLIEVLTSEDVRAFIAEKYGVAVVPVF